MGDKINVEFVVFFLLLVLICGGIIFFRPPAERTDTRRLFTDIAEAREFQRDCLQSGGRATVIEYITGIEIRCTK